jgi:FecR-like protein
VVRLKAGRVHLEVHKLATGERFRVVAGDGEVEVRGTAFDVEASEDHLESVHVDHGWVEVRPSGLDPVLLGAGEQWHAAPAQPALVPEPSPPPALVLAPSRPAAIPRTVPPPPQLVAEDVSDEPVSEPDQAPPPSPQEAAFARGWDALRGGQPAQAVEAFHEAWGGAPDGPIAEDAQFWEAVALARAHRTPEAISSMQLFLGSHPRSVRTGELSVMLGWLLLDSGATEEARSRFDAARTDPNPAVRDGARKGLAAAQGSSSSTRPP